jgi:hypothetical protein
MNRSIFFRVLLGIVLVGALLGLSALAYSAGVARGIASAASLPEGQALPDGWAWPDGRVVPFAHYYGMPFGRHFFGFGPLSCLVPFFLLLLVLLALRGLFGGGRHWRHAHWAYGPWGHGPWGEGGPEQGVPPHFAEWHRRSHEQPPAAPEQ